VTSNNRAVSYKTRHSFSYPSYTTLPQQTRLIIDTIPVEIFEEILKSLGEWEFPVTARFRTLTPSSRQAILNARLVRRCFRASSALDALFVTVFEETPFRWVTRLPTLTEVSITPYAERMYTLSVCAMNMELTAHDYSWFGGGGEFEYLYRSATWLPQLLACCTGVKHLRFYQISPDCSEAD
jgi:hypothetical protein